MDRHIYDDVLDDFKLYFPSISARMINWYPSGRHEITVKLDDRSKLYYNSLTKSIQRIPRCEDVEKISEDEWRDRFSAKLSNIIYDRGISQIELSEITGISPTTISKYVSGKSSPSSYTLSVLARALECSVSELTDF